MELLPAAPGQTVSEVVEKQVVSNEATVGIYNFRRGKDFVRAAETMIAKSLRVNGEFYVAPAYNELIAEHAKFSRSKPARNTAACMVWGFRKTWIFSRRPGIIGSAQNDPRSFNPGPQSDGSLCQND